MKMKLTFAPVLLAAALLWPAAAPLAAAAPQRLATVNLEKVYKGYWRTAQEDKKIAAARESVVKRLETLRKDQEELAAQLNRMNAMINRPGLGQVAKARHTEEFNKKRAELEQLVKTMQAYTASSEKKLGEMQREAFGKIRDEIKTVISAQAKQKGFAFVVDSKALLFAAADADITTPVLAQLNVNDPGKTAPPKDPAPKKK